jgi:hypothetical protein
MDDDLWAKALIAAFRAKGGKKNGSIRIAGIMEKHFSASLLKENFSGREAYIERNWSFSGPFPLADHLITGPDLIRHFLL